MVTATGEHQLSFCLEGVNSVEAVVNQFSAQPALPESGVRSHEDAAVQWSDDDIDRLKQKLLVYTLKCLRNNERRRSARKELMEWVMEPLSTKMYAHPLSFEDCCLASGLHASVMQQQLAGMFPELLD